MLAARAQPTLRVAFFKENNGGGTPPMPLGFVTHALATNQNYAAFFGARSSLGW